MGFWLVLMRGCRFYFQYRLVETEVELMNSRI
jgi:hypothetical protein